MADTVCTSTLASVMHSAVSLFYHRRATSLPGDALQDYNISLAVFSLGVLLRAAAEQFPLIGINSHSFRREIILLQDKLAYPSETTLHLLV